jgi:hypothetical protein
MLNKLITTSLLASVLIAPSAMAEKATIEADNDVYISGLSSYQKVEVTYEGVPKVSKKTSNECGYIRLASSTSTPINVATDTITFASTPYVLATVPLGASLNCINGVLEGTVSGVVQKDSDGRVYITGLSAFADYDVTFNNIFTSRKIKANTCGIAKISNSDKYDNTAGIMTLKDADTLASIGTLPASMPTGDGPLCKRGVGFFPVGYPAADNF